MSRMNYISIALAVIVADQAVKAAVVAAFAQRAVLSVIPGFFQLVHVDNPGIAFGLFADSGSRLASVLLILLSAAAILFVGWLIWTNQAGTAGSVGLALILGGASGNLIDRIARGEVVDFLDFYIGSYHWPAFNIADSAIVIGALLLLSEIFLAPQEEKVISQ